MTAAPNHLLSRVQTGTALLTMAICLKAQAASGQTAPGPVSLSEASVEGAGKDDRDFKRDRLESPKFTQPILDTPKSITVIPQSVIQSTASTSLTEALRTVPGITFGAGEGGNPVGDRPFLRGADTQSSTYVDGVRDIGAKSREVFNLDSIEVVKGSSGAVGGRGAVGGSINLISKTPKEETFLGASVGLGSSAYRRATLDFNQKVADGIAVRLNAMAHENKVAGRDQVNQSRWGVAPSVAFGLNSPTRVTLSYYHLSTDDLPEAGTPMNNPAFLARTDGRPRLYGIGDGSPFVSSRNAYYGLSDRDFQKETTDIGTLQIEHDFSNNLTLRNTTRYSQSIQDYVLSMPDDSKGNIYYGIVWRRANQRYTEVEGLVNQTDLYGKFSTGSVKHSFSAGIELSREKGYNDTYVVPTGSNVCPTGTGAASAYNCTTLFSPNPADPWTGAITRGNNPSRPKTDTLAAYFFDTLEFTPQWQANFGVRYDNYDASFKSAFTSGVQTRFKREDNIWSVQGGLVYKPVPNGTIYASYSTSATPSGASLGQGSDPQALSSLINADLAPAKNKNYELGVKWEVLGGRLQLTSALFRSETENVRITQADGSIAMAGKKRADGVEFGIAGKITDEWEIFGGYTYVKSELVNNGGAGTAFGAQNGLEFPNTPRVGASVWSTYKVLPQLTLGGGAFFVSKVWGNEATNKWIPSYWRFDASATYEFNEKVNLQLNVQNIGNKMYFTQVYSTHFATMAPGRSAILAVNAKF